jgi:pimeloyl-ACP methyl ester carboxylesterase
MSIVTISCKKKKEEMAQPATGTTQEQPVTYLSKSEFLSSYTALQFAILGLAQPELKPLLTQVKYDVNNYKILYKTKYKGNTVIASSLLSVPKGSVKWPILSYQHGTTFDNAEAPTSSDYEKLATAAMASMGYITLAPDYLGLGSSLGITHPYYVAEYSASAVRDLVEAAKEFLKEENIAHSNQLFLAGYSQGGNVTLASAKNIEANPIPGLNLTATAAGAGGYNMNYIFKLITTLENYPSPNYIAYIVQAYRTAYDWSTPLSYYFREPYASRIPSLINGQTPSGTVNDKLTTILDSLLQPNFVTSVSNGTDAVFLNALTKNSLHNWRPTKPLRFYHGTKDEVVPYVDSDSTYHHMLSLGSTSVDFIPLVDKDHGSGVIPMLADVLPWFNSFLSTP